MLIAQPASWRWWQSWWNEERTARRSLQLGSESGARMFVSQYDDNGDNYLSRRELPRDDRDDFDAVDRNGDGFLSVAEVRRYGQDYFEIAERPRMRRNRTARTAYRGDGDNDRTWSEWWDSWWSDQDQPERLSSDLRQKFLNTGARQFIREHDLNGDGVLVRSELPDGMYDDFESLDDNDDRKITRQEIMRHIPDSSESQASNR